MAQLQNGLTKAEIDALPFDFREGWLEDEARQSLPKLFEAIREARRHLILAQRAIDAVERQAIRAWWGATSEK